MCCLFGLIDYAGWFSPKHKNKVLSILAAACEVRGTGATAIPLSAGSGWAQE